MASGTLWELLKNNIDLASDYTPEESAAYQITAVGACQGFARLSVESPYVR